MKSCVKFTNLCCLKNKIILFSVYVSLGVITSASFAKDASRMGVEQSFIFDDNPNMNSNASKGIYGFSTKLFLLLDKETPTSNIISEFSVKRNQFDDKDFNSTDYFVRSNYNKKSLLWDFGISGSAKYDTTRDDDITNAGIFTQSDRRLGLKISPRIGYKLSPLTQYSLTNNFEAVYYDNDNLVDYAVVSLAPSVTHIPHPSHSLSAALQARHYETIEGTKRKVDSIGPYFGWKYDFHHKYSLELFGGALALNSNGYSGRDDGWKFSPIYEAKINYNGKNNNASLGILRSREAYSNGVEYDQTQIGIENRLKINPLWFLNSRLSYKTVKTSNASQSDLDSIFEEFVTLNYNPSDQWGLSLIQQYRIQKLQNGNNADRNTIKFNISYNFGGVTKGIRN